MPSLGIIIGLPIAGVLFIATAIAFFVLRYWAKEDDDFTLPKWGAVGVALVIVGIAAIAFWPYRWEYHSWQTTTGTIQTVSKRLVSTGDKTMEERFVVAFTDGRQRACDDSRCSLLHPGMTLTLRCKRAYQWGATPGYDCNYVGARS